MFVDLKNVDQDSFKLKEGEFLGREAVLVNPVDQSTKFTQENKIFRSSVWDKNTGKLLSAGLPKFVNFGENEENFPVPRNFKDCKIVEKMDGSCCIIDFDNDQISMRTRGTLSVDTLENYQDFYKALTKNSTIISWLRENPEYSMVFEIVTPNVKIVINYGEIEFYLLGIISKVDYSMMSQSEVSDVAEELGCKRPELYFGFSDMGNLLTEVKTWEGLEGVCIYSENDQTIHKVKSAWYMKLHYIKSDLGRGFKGLVDIWVDNNITTYSGMYDYLKVKYDYEVAEQCKKEIKEIEAAQNAFFDILDDCRGVLKSEEFVKLDSRKDQAQFITRKFAKDKMTGIVFNLLDGKELSTRLKKERILNGLEE